MHVFVKMFRLSNVLLVTAIVVVRSITGLSYPEIIVPHDFHHVHCSENEKLNEYNGEKTTPAKALEIGPNNVHPDLFTNGNAFNCSKKRLTYNWRRATADEYIRTVCTKLHFPTSPS